MALPPWALLILPDPQDGGRCAAWTPDKQHGLRSWLEEYVDWLGSSDHARDEFRQKNNHGTWYDTQAASNPTVVLHR
jgi:hypothetical protein